MNLACYPNRYTVLLLLAALFCQSFAARFAPTIRFRQPNGTEIELHGTGNEYYAIYETVEGYTVLFDPQLQAYCYALLDRAADHLFSSGVQVGSGDPALLRLPLHLRPSVAAVQLKQEQQRRTLDERLGLTERMASLKAARKAGNLSAQALRYSTTLGSKCGLTLLIDFDETVGTVPRASVEDFLNGDNYRGNGNKSSVKKYYAEVSDGKLNYTNLVIGYVRIPKSMRPRSYYNDLNRDNGLPVNELIRDAIKILTNQPNYMNEVVPKLDALSLNEAGEVTALNVFVAGADSGVWARGLWPHMGNLFSVGPQELWPGGKKVNYYQMTTMTFQNGPLQISTFCHETGHLLCGFPDIYDYDNTSTGGAGLFCIMNSHNTLTNPQHPCAYLKFLAGWATVTDLVPGDPQTYSLTAAGTSGNHFLRYKPWVGAREYFLVENRQPAGRETDLPGGGILVWHIDELGNNNIENLAPNSTHANYEVTLVQADNKWDLQHGSNSGDATDPFFKGNATPRFANRLSDSTSPNANWWNGTRSGLALWDFSAKGRIMTLTAQVTPPAILRDPINQTVPVGSELFLSVQMATNEMFSYTWLKDGAPLPPNDRTVGIDQPNLVIFSATAADAGKFSVLITNSSGYSETSRVATVTIADTRQLASIDLGDATLRPGATESTGPNAYRVTGGGTGFHGQVDGCRLLYEEIAGDFDAKVQILRNELENSLSDANGSAGLMVRRDLSPGSPAASVTVHPGFIDTGYVQARTRARLNSSPKSLAYGGGIPQLNNWVRVKREGDLVSLYYSTDGAKWDWLNTVQLELDERAYFGMAVASEDPVFRMFTEFNRYSVQLTSPPTCAIYSTTNSAQAGSGSAATMTVVSSRRGPMKLAYRLSDSQANGVLFETLSGELTLEAGANIAELRILPTPAVSEPALVQVTLLTNGVNQSSGRAILFPSRSGRGLKREVYPSIIGTKISDLTRFFRYPGGATVGTATDFEYNAPANSGQVLSGYLRAPVAGDYRFYLASSGGAELWLSTDNDPANTRKIAEELKNNTKRNWPGFDSKMHISAPIRLEAGSSYYVKVIQKVGYGTANLAVAWQLPGAPEPVSGSAPISGDFLSWSSAPTAMVVDAGLRLQLISSAGEWQLSLNTSTSDPITIESSPDLQHWTPVLTNSFRGTIKLLDLEKFDPAISARFYRTLQ